MKKTLIAFMISSSLLLTACDEKVTTELAKKEQDLTALQAQIPSLNVEIYPLFSRSETFKNKDFDGNPQDVTISYFYSLAKTNVPWLDDLLAKRLLSTLKEKPETANPIEELKATLEQDYQQNKKGLQEESSFGMDFTNEMSYLGQRGNIATFSLMYSDYTGGAHGNYFTTYLNIDGNTKEIITLDKLIPKANQQQLKALLWEAYKNKAGYDEQGKPIEPFASQNEFDVVDNFLFTADGIKFIYAPNMIGAFAEGEIDLTLYWDQINALLNPAYQRTKKDGFNLNPNNDLQ